MGTKEPGHAALSLLRRDDPLPIGVEGEPVRLEACRWSRHHFRDIGFDKCFNVLPVASRWKRRITELKII